MGFNRCVLSWLSSNTTFVIDRRELAKNLDLHGRIFMHSYDHRKVEPFIAGLRSIFERHSGFVYVADVAVSRQEYFGKK